ncbi:HD domain-containing protein [Planktotalea sp.]|uniref:HD domain-containing protein n=1 Tax=Planktotalea sp. TaxID=2029877 RepID=UPI0035C8176D
MSVSLLRNQDLTMWDAARPYLDVRNNDEHTLVAYGLAKALLDLIPEADENIVLPAVLLHDVGWKKIDPDLLLLAIGKNPTRKDLVRDHEVYGVEIARDIITSHGNSDIDVEAVLSIIDGHDTDKTARSINDAIVKDADKGWRATAHGMRIIRGWYDISVMEYVETLEAVSLPFMLTDAGRAMANGYIAAIRAEQALGEYMKEFTDV